MKHTTLLTVLWCVIIGVSVVFGAFLIARGRLLPDNQLTPGDCAALDRAIEQGHRDLNRVESSSTREKMIAIILEMEKQRRERCYKVSRGH